MAICAENKGKTLHLLKKASKAVPQNRKRVKRDIFASPLDFQRLHPEIAEEQKDEEAEMLQSGVAIESACGQVDLHRSMGFVPADGGPNQIGNVEDGPVVPDNVHAEGQGMHGGASAVE